MHSSILNKYNYFISSNLYSAKKYGNKSLKYFLIIGLHLRFFSVETR